MNSPTQAGFIAWVRAVMGVNTTVLPDNSVSLVYAYEVALAIVNLQINCASGLMYTLAVYNLAGDNLINWAQDVPDAPVNAEGQAFFAALRASFGCANFIGGTVSTAADEGSSDSFATVEGLKNLTLGQLQNLKTPYGRQYLSIASSVGTLWGVN